MRVGSRNSILVLFMASVAVGLALSFVPWGNPTGFHGKGFPIASEMWDRSPQHAGRLVDYPNPYAVVLNSLVVFVVGALLMYAWRSLSSFRDTKRERSRRAAQR